MAGGAHWGVLRLGDGRYAVVRGRAVASVHGTLSTATREARARSIAAARQLGDGLR